MKHKNKSKYIMFNKKVIIEDIVSNIQSDNREEASSLIRKYNISIQEIHEVFHDISILKTYYSDHDINLLTKENYNDEIMWLKSKNTEHNEMIFIAFLMSSLGFFLSFLTGAEFTSYSKQLFSTIIIFVFPVTVLTTVIFLKIKNIKRINKIKLKAIL